MEGMSLAQQFLSHTITEIQSHPTHELLDKLVSSQLVSNNKMSVSAGFLKKWWSLLLLS